MNARPLLQLIVSFTLALGAICAVLFALEQQNAEARPLAGVTRTYPGASPCNTTLQACISASSDGDSILIVPNTYVTDSLTITRAVDLIGNGSNPAAVKLRPTSGRMIKYQSVPITASFAISNLTVENGNSGASSGGGIRVDSGAAPLFFNIVISNSIGGGGGGLRVIPSIPVTLINVTVFSNTSTAGGGGIDVAGDLTLINSRIERNSASTDGGGVHVAGSLRVTNTTFATNKALAGDGGSIYAIGQMTLSGSLISHTVVNQSTAMTNGGGIYAASGVFLGGLIEFHGNVAQNGEGGAMYVVGNIGDDVISRIQKWWDNNSSAGNGGAIRVLGNVLLISAPEFLNNRAGGGTSADGGGIYADGSVVLGNGNPSSGNSARNGGVVYAKGQVVVETDVTANNTAALNGGCAYSELQVLYQVRASGCVAGQFGGVAYSPLKVTLLGNALFNQNRAGNSGGVAFANVVEVFRAQLVSNTAPVGGAVGATTTLDIRDATFISNTAANAGGAASISNTASTTGTAFIANSLFTTNRVTSTNGVGGALFVRGSAVVTNSTFISNGLAFASGQRGGAIAGLIVSTTASSFVGNGAKFGGAISATTALVARSVFTANGDTSGLGAINGGALIATNATVLDSRFISNTANTAGGGIYADLARIVNSYFEGNGAADEGSAVYISNTATISQSQFIRNADFFDRSSAVYLNNANNATSTVVDSLFDGNVAEIGIAHGGAIEAVRGTLNVSGSTFNNNRSKSGGAIFMPDTLNVLTSTFFNNLGLCCGGGGALNGGGVFIQNSTFISNYADCCDGGGAVFGNFVFVQNSQFYSNSVESRMDGGAIKANLLSVDSSTFESNRQLIDTSANPNLNTGRGGAIYVGFNFRGDVTNSTFRRNRANDGGALACDSHCTVQTSLFENNVADKPDDLTLTNIGTGGAIQTHNDLEVYRSRFVRNRAGVAGGAIFQNRQIQLLASDAFIQNSLFAENLASNSVLGAKGNAIAITGTVSNGKLFYNTVVSDSLTAGTAIAVLSGTVSVIDNIITNHAVGLEEGVGGNVFENFNLYFGNTANLAGAVTSGGSTFTGDPLFASPATDDYHLGPFSPAIDNGTDVLVNVDFDGDTRPIGAGFDIGFDERNAAAFKLFLPLIVR